MGMVEALVVFALGVVFGLVILLYFMAAISAEEDDDVQ